MTPDHHGAPFTDKQRESLRSRRADQGRTLSAMHRLEEALAEAAPRRQGPWLDSVIDALVVLEAVVREELANAARPDSLFSDLARNQPRLRNRVRGLRLQYRKLLETITDLRHELGDIEHRGDSRDRGDRHDRGSRVADIDAADIRQRLGWVLTALRHQRARESDLIYEAYYDAFKLELGGPEPTGASF